MDDLDPVPLAVVDIIPRERIARKGMDVKGKFRGGRQICLRRATWPF
jgi:hypothetical protein